MLPGCMIRMIGDSQHAIALMIGASIRERSFVVSSRRLFSLSDLVPVFWAVGPYQVITMSVDDGQLEVCSCCGLPPHPGQKLRRCMRCYTAAYHDRNCQSKHFPVHRRTCNSSGSPCGYRVVDMDGKGKSVVATRKIGQGELLPSMKDPRVYGFRPLVPPVLLANMRDSHCPACFHKRGKNDLCLSDHPKYIAYVCSKCSSALPDQAREEISAISKLLAEADSRPEGRSIQILPTAVLTYRLLSQVEIGAIDWGVIEAMQTHDAPTNVLQHSMAVQWIVSQLLLLTGRFSPSLAQKIVATATRIQYNAFTISDDAGDSIGFGVYESPAHRFNHSCKPNATQSFADGLRLNVGTLQPISPGEEITLSYIDTSHSVGERRKQLQSGYNFHCCCALCTRQQTSQLGDA